MALKEGLLQVVSTGPVFEVHKKKIIDEFTQFKQQRQLEKQAMQSEFEQYKQQTRQKLVEYRHQFTPCSQIVWLIYRLDKAAMSEANNADFNRSSQKRKS